jgi:hypothetical protein
MLSPSDLATRPFLTVQKLAARIDSHVSTIWRWNSRGLRGVKLPIHTLGGKCIVFDDDFAAFIRDTTRDPHAPPKSQPATDARIKSIAAARETEIAA